MTLIEIIERIKLSMDHYSLLEFLDLPFEELVDFLADAIEEKADDFEEVFTFGEED